ncbi:hypothetical protein COW46_04450 [Candidatus Gracilibacteria bacterium CG17_big_fil_post_rev_8_21_14_2_50_48_13]|nr:MAG: hypothetical protein COW46_04450 [Candidatus Gracilibacteria bacterium CG17_big_fil_post_rev_8_21_14_2_50_48_13]
MQQYFPLLLVVLTNLLPAAIWAWFYTSRDPSKEPRVLLLFAFVVGGLMTLPVMLINSLAGTFGAGIFPWKLAAMVIPVLGAALVEELVKHTGVLFVMRQDRLAHDEVLDGIIYAVIVALGFAFVENIVYIWLSLWNAGTLTFDVVSVFILRSLLSMFAHTVFSGFFGYYYALGYIEPQLRREAHDRQALTLRSAMKGTRISALSFAATAKVLRGGHDHFVEMKKSTSFQLVLEGMWLAAILHMLYNLFLTWPPFGLSPFVVVTPYLGVLGGLLVWVIIRVRKPRV